MTQEQKQAVFDYLRQLRASGKINMFLAPSVITQVFGIDKETASKLFWEWAEAFSDEDTEDND